VYSTCRRSTGASLTDILARILARKIARVGEDPRACPARTERSYSCGKLNREVAGHVDILATILARKSARMSVSVSVSVSWNSSLSADADKQRDAASHLIDNVALHTKLDVDSKCRSICDSTLLRRPTAVGY